MTATAEIPPTRAEINRRNAQRSTGPKSQAGKERSRFNALKHGCRARLPILPGEDPEAYQDRLDAWIDKFQPRDAVEAYMVERAVHASWQLDRADRAEVAAMVEAADEQALRRARDVLELGATLFRAPTRIGDGNDQELPLSWPFDPEHPRYPSRVVVDLEGTAQGCTWLLQQWTALGEALDGGRIWRAVDRLRAIRLLGKQPLDAVADEMVLSIYMACQAMDPHGPDVFAEPLSDLRHPKAAAAYQRHTARFAAARAERSPRDAAAARAALRAIVSTAMARVEALREVRAAAEAESAGMSEVSARLSHRAKETVDWLWKHQARCGRSLCRTFDELRKVRREFGDDQSDSLGPMSEVRGPSSGSELVEGSDLPATGAERAAVEPAGDHDARDVTDEANGTALGAGLMTPPDRTALGAGRSALGAGLMTPPDCPTEFLPTCFNHPIADMSHEAIAPPESPPVAADNGPPTTDRTNEAIAPIEPVPVTTDVGRGATDHGPREKRRTTDQDVIVLTLLALFFSTVVAAAFGTWVPARATAPTAFPDHRPRPEGHGDHNVTNEPNPGSGPAIVVAGLRRAPPGTTRTDQKPVRHLTTVPLIPPRAPPSPGSGDARDVARDGVAARPRRRLIFLLIGKRSNPGLDLFASKGWRSHRRLIKRKGRHELQISKAVITAAGRGARQFPAADPVQKAMLPLVDRDGVTKPVLQIIAEEAIASGIEEICVVCAPGDEAVYRDHFRNFTANVQSAKGIDWAEEQARRLADLEQRLQFAVQPEPDGYGHAVWCARSFAGNEPVLLLLGDHLYISAESRRCARQLIELATAENCAVSAVQATREHLIHQYGTLTGRRLPEHPEVYVIEEIIEKPNPTLAELRLHVPGLRVGHYLCFFGMHILTPTVFELLDDLVGRDVRELGSIQLTTALNQLAQRERYLALETRGSRFNLGVKFGVVEAQIALALAGVDREQILSLLLESVVRVEQHTSR